MAAFTFGLDISHHQDARLDLAQCRREGIEFVILKATEGASYVDPEFAANLAEARKAGLLTAAYHYVRSNAPAADQVANVRRVVPLDVPVIPDVEANSGILPLTTDIVRRLRDAGYRVPLLYLPRWYWLQLGSPDMRGFGLPPLWSSRYPDNVVGSLADEFADVPAGYWNGYGGLDVAVLQFTSSVRIAGHQPIDANAFRGSRDELAKLLGYGGFLMALSDQEQRDLYNRVFGMLRQRHYETDQFGVVHEVAAPTPNSVPATVLDTLDGNYLVGRLAALEEKQAAPAPVELTDAQLEALADKLADRLGALRFVANPEGS